MKNFAWLLVQTPTRRSDSDSESVLAPDADSESELELSSPASVSLASDSVADPAAGQAAQPAGCINSSRCGRSGAWARLLVTVTGLA